MQLGMKCMDDNFFEPLHFYSDNPFGIKIPFFAYTEYSFDNRTWEDSPLRMIKCKPSGIYIRGNSMEQVSDELYHFVLHGNDVKCDGSVMSLLGTKEMPIGAFDSLFRDCDCLVKAPRLPSLDLSPYCYYNMFCNCTNLKYPPELPATKLEYCCYSNMFTGCVCLKEVPILSRS